jgi:hypothetical protein
MGWHLHAPLREQIAQVTSYCERFPAILVRPSLRPNRPSFEENF